MSSKLSIRAGGLAIGGGAPVSVQSMTNTKTADAAATSAQIKRLVEAGCEIVRVSVYDQSAAAAIRDIRAGMSVPLVADIHFDHRLAIAAMENGVDKVRINPGNIGSEAKVRELTAAARAHHVPIRIGVNAGSLEKELLEKYGPRSPEAMVKSALSHVRLLEREGFYDIVISLKASDVLTTVRAYRLMSSAVDYPLHIGVTEAGFDEQGVLKGAIGIGALLLDGIGDTLRVSLTGDPVKEVETGIAILRALGLRREGVEIISCPTCGRTRTPLEAYARQIEARLSGCKGALRVAVMGCAVNGPGEARDADIGVAFGDGNAVVFKGGDKVFAAGADEAVAYLVTEAEKMMA